MQGTQQKANEAHGWLTRRAIRYLLIAALIAAVCMEGYYIFALRDTIRRQNEDLRSISVQLQLLKSERESLNEEITSTRKQAGEGSNGDSAGR
jgi:hypothetical protein